MTFLVYTHTHNIYIYTTIWELVDLLLLLHPLTEYKKIHYFSVDTCCADYDLSVLICTA